MIGLRADNGPVLCEAIPLVDGRQRPGRGVVEIRGSDIPAVRQTIFGPAAALPFHHAAEAERLAQEGGRSVRWRSSRRQRRPHGGVLHMGDGE